MIFSFLKYIQPIDYFNLSKQDGNTVFPDPDSLPTNVLSQLIVDDGYEFRIARKRDLAWQAIQKGYIGTAHTLRLDEPLLLVDEYRFIRKYFNRIWSYYILCIRLMTLHNPFKELVAFYGAKNTPRFNVFQNPITYPEWSGYRSKLLAQQPTVSVIIPTLNRYEYLSDGLHDLEKQDYTNFEVIVVDQSDPFQPTFYENFRLNIRVIHQAKKEICLARDTGIISAHAEYVLLFDDDSRVESDWISNHVKCLDFFQASISSGTSVSVVGAKVPESYSYLRLSNQIDTGNVMLKKSVLRKIGLFDRQLEKIGLEDAELGLRAYLMGFLNISNPFSQRLHLKAKTGGFREIGIWDAVRPANWFAPRPTPSALYIGRKYFGNQLTIYNLIANIPPSLIPFKYKRNNKMLLMGYLLFILFCPVVLMQVWLSWQTAERKLREGPRIKKIIEEDIPISLA